MKVVQLHEWTPKQLSNPTPPKKTKIIPKCQNSGNHRKSKLFK